MIKKKIWISIIVIFLLGLILKNYTYNDNLDNFENILNNKYYLTFFSNNDIKLRGFNDYNECEKYYNKAILPFSSNELRMIEYIKHDIKYLLGENFKKIFNEINFLKGKNNLENGMPHTRDKYIVFSKSLIENLYSKYLQNMNFILKDIENIKLISHEQFHVFQRFNFEKIDILYTKYWNLIKYSKKLPNKILSVNRTNPDALPNIHYLFPINNYFILPLCIYNDSARTISDCRLVYLELNKNMEFLDIDNYKNLLELKEFSEYFGNQGRNNYHPNELSASIFEDIVINTVFNQGNNTNNKGYKKMVLFLKDNGLL